MFNVEPRISRMFFRNIPSFLDDGYRSQNRATVPLFDGNSVYLFVTLEIGMLLGSNQSMIVHPIATCSSCIAEKILSRYSRCRLDLEIRGNSLQEDKYYLRNKYTDSCL